MMGRHRHLRAFAAVLAAYGLVLQAVLVGLVLGATAAPAAHVAPAWAVLCNASGLVPAPDGAPSGQKGARAPTCCVAGACGLAVGLPGAPSVLPPVPVRLAEAISPAASPEGVHQGPRGHLPQARAPPFANG